MVETIEEPKDFRMSRYETLTHNERVLKLKEDMYTLKHKRKLLLCCPKCRGSLTILNFRKDDTWRCYLCKESFTEPLFRMWDIHFGHSGTVRRDFTKSQKKSGASFEPLDLADIVKLLNKNQATLREQYELKTYRRKIRENALVACITLTGARVSEILGVRKNKEYVTPPLRLSQLRLEHEEVTDKDVIVFKDITCLKHKPRVRYDTDGNPIPFVPQRELWYPYDGVFKELYLFIDKHIEVMKQVGLKEADPPIFNLSRSVVNLYLNRIFGNNLEQLGINTLTNRKEMIAYPHWLRHSNLTYMADKFKLSDSQIRAYTGWSTPAMAAKYVHLKPKNLYQSMMQEK